MNADTLASLLNDHQLYHSELQMDSFIIRTAGGTTAYGQYKQALRELHKRWRGLKQLQTEKELLAIDIAELEASNKDVDYRHKHYFEEQRNAVKLTQKRMAMEDLDRSLSDTQREFEHFYAAAERLKAIVGELTPERRAALDEGMWIAAILEKAGMELTFRGGISMETAGMVMAMPLATRQSLLAQIRHDGKGIVHLLENFDDAPATAPEKALPRDPCGCAPAGVAPGMVLPC